MEIILLEKVINIGELGEKIKVKDGYARNFLIPKGKAVRATKENIEKFEARRAELEKIAAEKINAAQQRAEKLKDLTIVLTRKAQEEGKLFGSVTIRDIAEALAEKSIEVEKREIIMPENSINMIGEYEINVQLHSDVKAIIKVEVKAE